MVRIKQIALVILSIALGTTFLYSAWTKLNPIQSFEYTMVEFAHMPWLLSAVAARLIIGVEAALGGLILLHFFGRRKWVLRSSLLLLILLSVYLVYLWATQGNDVNCGCFGDAIWMSPSESLIKNGVLILAVWLLIRFHKGLQYRWLGIVTPLLFTVTTVLPFILYGIPDNKPNWLQKDSFQLDMAPLYDRALATPVAPASLKTGKHVISFLSLSCSHCRTAAHKMTIMKDRNPSLPFYFVIAGKEEYLQSFWEETKSESIPHTKLDGDAFTDMVGYSWPVIYWINDGRVEAQANYIQLDQGEIENWLKK